MYATYPMTLDPASGIWSYTAPAAASTASTTCTRRRSSCAPPTRSRPTSSPIRTRSRWRATARAARSSRWTMPRCSRAAGRNLHKPHLAAPEDIVLYELHVRDFSATDATRAGGPARHLRGVHAEALGRHEASGDAGPGGRHARAPAAGVRLRDHQRGQVHLAIALVRHARGPAGRLFRAAGAGRGDGGPRRLQLGLRPAALQRARGQLRHRCRRLRSASSSSARWCSR